MQDFHAVKIQRLEVLASRDWFLDLYVVVQSEGHPEMANREEASKLTDLNPKATTFPGGTLRYMLAGDRCALKHTRWQGCRTVP